MFPLPGPRPRPGPGPGRGFVTGRHRSRVKGHPEVRGEFPVATLADEIETPGEGQVRALVTVAGNPALSTPNSARLDAALGRARVHGLRRPLPQRDHPPRRRDPAAAVAARAQPLRPRLLQPVGAQRRQLVAAALRRPRARRSPRSSPASRSSPPGQGAGADPAVIDDLLLDGAARPGHRRARLARRRPRRSTSCAAELTGDATADRPLVDVMIRTGAYGDWFGAVPDGLSLDKLARPPPRHRPRPARPRLPAALRTPSGTVELAPPADRRRPGPPRAAARRPDADPGDLVLIGRRHLRSNNSWMHNVERAGEGHGPLHPAGAPRRRRPPRPRSTAATAEVASRVGAVVAPVEVTDAIRAGVVSLPHGWGHDRPGRAASASPASARRGELQPAHRRQPPSTRCRATPCSTASP